MRSTVEIIDKNIKDGPISVGRLFDVFLPLSVSMDTASTKLFDGLIYHARLGLAFATNRFSGRASFMLNESNQWDVNSFLAY